MADLKRNQGKYSRNIVVVGGNAAGLKAACRVRRLLPEAHVQVVEAGTYLSYAACGLPYFLGGDIEQFDKLRSTPYGLYKDPDYFRTVKGVEVRLQTRAVRIDRHERVLHCDSTVTGEVSAYPYDTLVLATGTTPILPDIPGVDLPEVLTFTRPEDAIRLKKDCETGKIGKVALIGAGYIGLELCEAFASLWGIDVTVFEMADHVLPAQLDREMARNVEALLQDEDIQLHTSTACTAILRSGYGLQISTTHGTGDEVYDRVIIGIGSVPAVEIARSAGLKIGITGALVVNEQLQTSDPVIYAAGDCIELQHRISRSPVRIPLGSLANRQGRVVGDNIAGLNSRFGPVTGSGVLKVFSWNIATTGLNLTAAQKAGFNVGEVWGVFDDKASYYPGGEKCYMKMLFDKSTGKVLGVQAVGPGDVIRRIDAASALMQHDATLADVMAFEPAYSPPYAEPWDPLHHLACVAENVMNKGIAYVHPEFLFSDLIRETTLVDVRNAAEREKFSLPDGVKKVLAIPLNELREKTASIPRKERILTICQRAPRAYEAALILKEAGHVDVAFIGGGMLFAERLGSAAKKQ